ncbi:MAG TPA: transglutaminase-like domain-containing protein [Streptosporangiaceae bacterium]|jgi:hypothetical protein
MAATIGTPAVIDYSVPGPLTDLGDLAAVVLTAVPADPVEICRITTGLIVHPFQAEPLGLPAARLAEQQLRPARSIALAVLKLADSPLDVRREPARRAVGTCRNFVTLSCALLRHRGIAARARCGFGTYFRSGYGYDHWITEYWDDAKSRWVRVDTQHLGSSFVECPADLRPGEFLTGGEAWAAYRAGDLDASRYGVPGTENFGPGEIRGNAIRDLAALNKVEMLPWDEWGRMTASYQGETGPDYDALLDDVAAVCGAADAPALAGRYALDELRVPAELLLGA